MLDVFFTLKPLNAHQDIIAYVHVVDKPIAKM
jgi:hypothetical protein